MTQARCAHLDANLEPRWSDGELECLTHHSRRLEASGRISYFEYKKFESTELVGGAELL